MGGIGAEMAVGMAMAQQMMNQPGGVMAQTTPAAGAAPAAAAGIPEMLGPPMRRRRSAYPRPTSSPALEAGDLKGKSIGTQWRITRAAIADFLK